MSRHGLQVKWIGSVVFLGAVLVMGWRLGGDADKRVILSPRGFDLVAKGPQDPAYCAPPAVPRPPPPVDSPFGVHLFSTTPLGVVRPVRGAFEVLDDVGLPGKSTVKKEAGLTGGNESGYEDVQSVGILLEEFRRAFGAMPTGELNDEIVRRLQGENPKGIAVLPKSHAAINENGELMDRWGTPYRFHPESAWVMTVRSAGEDRRMWTGDDIVSEAEATGLVQK
jgi:hypothetical protein